jgi:hypothetical protein
MKKGLFWTPRILSIIFVLFLSLMSLDVFESAQGFWQTTGALFLHLLPALILLAVVIISWKREIVGGVAFLVAGLAYIVFLLFSPFEWDKIMWAAQISGVSFLTGVLFFVGWRKKKRQATVPSSNDQQE